MKKKVNQIDQFRSEKENSPTYITKKPFSDIPSNAATVTQMNIPMPKKV